MWLDDLEIAIVERDAQKIGVLSGSELKFETIEEMQKAQYLLVEAAKVIYEMKDDTSAIMIKLKKNIEFLKATGEKKIKKLDVRS